MITFFSIPKPFAGHIGLIQENALRSWRRQSGCEVLLLGRDAGVKQAAARHGARWLPDLALNEYGTPLLDSAFALARATACHRLLCYINADIIVLDDFLEAVRKVRFAHFLMLGRRWDLDVRDAIDFGRPDCEAELRRRVRAAGVHHPPMGSDYFVFPKDSALAELPAFAVGRPAWDNWLIFRARHLGMPVVDASQAVTIIHQNHDYAHVVQRRGAAWEGPEGDRNRALTGGAERLFTLGDATHRLGTELRPAWDWTSLKRRLEAQEVLSPRFRKLRNLLRRARSVLSGRRP